jgi:hypothetical protein
MGPNRVLQQSPFWCQVQRSVNLAAALGRDIGVYEACVMQKNHDLIVPCPVIRL